MLWALTGAPVHPNGMAGAMPPDAAPPGWAHAGIARDAMPPCIDDRYAALEEDLQGGSSLALTECERAASTVGGVPRMECART